MKKLEKPEIRMTVNEDLAEGIYMASGYNFIISSPFYVDQGLGNASDFNHAIGCIYGSPIYDNPVKPVNPVDTGSNQGHTSGQDKRLVFQGLAQYQGPPMDPVRLAVTLHFENPLPYQSITRIYEGGNFGQFVLDENNWDLSNGYRDLTIYFDGKFDNPVERLGFDAFYIEFANYAESGMCYNTTAADPTIYIVR